MFNSKHEATVKLHNKGDLLPSKPNEHLNDAKGFAHTHEVRLFDISTGKYEVTERGGTMSDGEVRPPRKYVVFCQIFHAHVGDRGSTTFHALITLQQRATAIFPT